MNVWLYEIIIRFVDNSVPYLLNKIILEGINLFPFFSELNIVSWECE